jgi:four helix bundle protein
VQDFRKLTVWRRSHQLTLDVYVATRGFPRAENFGLRSQLRSSAASIGANIAEGAGRHGDRDFSRFLYFAMGSANELEYQLLLARDLALIPDSVYEQLLRGVVEVRKMLSSLLRKLGAGSW